MAGILVIDDSPSVRCGTLAMLRAAGHLAASASSAARALSLLRQHPVDLILTDIFMPGGDGLEIIVEVRRNWPGVPVIAMSAVSGRPDMLGVACRLGACATLRKPFSPEQLKEAVAGALAARGRRDA